MTVSEKLRAAISPRSKDIVRYNFFHMLLESTIFWTAMSLLDTNTVIAVFLDSFAGSPVYSGLAATLKTAMAAVGQFLMSMFISRLSNQRRAMRIFGFIGRPMVLVSAILMLVGLDGKAAAWAFLICYSLFYLFDGFVSLLWIEMMSRTIPVMMRGRVQSYNYVFGGIMGILGGRLVAWVMASSLDEHMRYIVIFGTAGLVLVLNACALALIRDKDGAEQEIAQANANAPRVDIKQYMRNFMPMIRSSQVFRRTTIARMLYLCGLLAAPVNILFGRSMGGLGDGDVATLLTVQVVGQLLGGVFWGQLSMRRGYRIVMILTQIANVAVGIVSVLSIFMAEAGANILLPLAFIMFFTQFSTVGWSGYGNYLIAGVPEDKRAMYNAMTSMAMLPANFGTLFVGMVSGSLGYAPVYAFTLICSIAGLAHCLYCFGGKRGITGDNI